MSSAKVKNIEGAMAEAHKIIADALRDANFDVAERRFGEAIVNEYEYCLRRLLQNG